MRTETALEEFQKIESRLFAIAYRMLGSASDAQDIVQEAYLRYAARPEQPAQVHSPVSYLTRVVTNLCLDHLKSARVRREQYVGLWLPEPVSTAHAEHNIWDSVEQRETISIAFLVLMECLTPHERAVFLLHDVFDYRYEEIAEMLSLSLANCRQIAHRARLKLEEKRPRFEVPGATHRQITERFLRACKHGDLQELTDLLNQDVSSWSDGGGKVSSIPKPVYGRDAVVRLVLGLMKKASAGIEFTLHEINYAPAILMWAGGQLVNVLVPEVREGQIQALRFILNPEKLAFLSRQLKPAG